MRPDLVIFCTPFFKMLIRIGKVKKSISFKKLILHCAVKSLYLTLRLRVQGSAMDWKYVQIHKPTFKLRISALKSGKLAAVVG